MAPPRPRQITHLSPIYRLYFLTIEPLGALAGTYLAYFRPQRLLIGTVPLPAIIDLGSQSTINALFPPPSSPHIPLDSLHELLLTNIAALYLLIAINEFFVLRLSRERVVWMGMIGGMLASDLGHLFAVWKIAPERMFQLTAWTSDEWVNYGTLWGGAVMRMFFLAGYGWR